MIRVIIFWGLCWGPLFGGKLPYGNFHLHYTTGPYCGFPHVIRVLLLYTCPSFAEQDFKPSPVHGNITKSLVCFLSSNIDTIFPTAEKDSQHQHLHDLTGWG